MTTSWMIRSSHYVLMIRSIDCTMPSRSVVPKGVPVYDGKYIHTVCSEIYLRYFLNTFLRFNLLDAKDKNKKLVGAKIVTFQSKKWCILRSDVPDDKQKLNETMDYACEHADCSAFADGGLCSGLGECEMVSYAFNSFFQMSNQSKESCDFDGLATQVEQDPPKDQCKFNIQIKPNVHEHIDSDSPALHHFHFHHHI
ncbi:putative glucan endo-1,3-beta-D-glucosidase [Helianthus annuus]|nr:putative glucan endo-1,3-beta-D-glucosidase [Helianthus annuus]